METSAFHIHLPESLVLPVRAGDDADAAQWITVDAEHDARYANLYGNHKEMVDMVADTLNPHVHARKPHEGYPRRLPILDEDVRWAVACPDYAPTNFTAADVLARSMDSHHQRGRASRVTAGEHNSRGKGGKRRNSNYEEATSLINNIVPRRARTEPVPASVGRAP
jgi:hypothetical protein